jgi:hypothetical protein
MSFGFGGFVDDIYSLRKALGDRHLCLSRTTGTLPVDCPKVDKLGSSSAEVRAGPANG